MKFFIIYLLLFFTLDAKYIIVPGVRPKGRIDKLNFHTILDFKNIPQNTAFYAKQIKPMAWDRQLKYSKRYLKKFFYPWQINKMHESYNNLHWQFNLVRKRVVYGLNRAPIAKKTWKWWIENSNFKALNSAKAKAISIKHSNLRAFPSFRDIYTDPYKSTQFFPFDYNQNSELHPNVPLFVSHYSLDKKWAFVKAGHTFGWIRVSNIALVDEKFIKSFKTKNYVVTIKDNMYIYKNYKPFSIIKLGSIFPIREGKIY